MFPTHGVRAIKRTRFAQVMALSLKCWLHRHENLSSDLQDRHKVLDTEVCASIPSAGKH